ncbi:MAG: preprotein translocase subunit SecG [Candidatus Omnitrophota bacterium]|nr:preprotein translocase subunit SecG [Candidatus Omnitrophota bacterium]
MYIFLIICHVLACLVLIGVILLQAGKGGGLSAEFGGGGGGFQSIFGTKTSAFLTRATAVCAVIFLTTSLTLALVSAKRGESLVVREVAKEEKAQTAAPATSTQPQPAAKDTSKP